LSFQWYVSHGTGANKVYGEAALGAIYKTAKSKHDAKNAKLEDISMLVIYDWLVPEAFQEEAKKVIKDVSSSAQAALETVKIRTKAAAPTRQGKKEKNEEDHALKKALAMFGR